jgi:hypothetical protein
MTEPTASAPGTTTTAPAPATTPAPAAGGFLDSIKLPDRSPAEIPATTQDTPPATTPAEGTTPDPAAPEAGATPPAAPVFKATVRGKEYTGEELVKAYQASTAEGLKIPALTETVKRHVQEITNLRAKITEFETKALETPPFKLLSKEELKELEPAEQTEYVIKKTLWEKERDERKSAFTKMQQERESDAAEIKSYIYNRTQEMFDDPVKYPGYKDLVPAMEDILDRVPQLGGMKETPELLFAAAYGLKKLREETVSKTEEERARESAALKANADATAAGSGNSPAPVGTPSTDNDSDEAFAKSILDAHNKSMVRL